ncbi:MAG: triphosphoribosyl-dephospho-CoA synthase [Gammaproteobacteria bacterium]
MNAGLTTRSEPVPARQPHCVTPSGLSQNRITAAMQFCFEMDVAALKPGNVHRYADGHAMTVNDFLTSAGVSVPVLADPARTVAARILAAATATREAVGCNTNLGMLLLFAPLAAAAAEVEPAQLQARVTEIVQQMDVTAAADIYAAIRLAQPGGLGDSDVHDVASAAEVDVITAMCAAQHRDRIAWQYANGFANVFGEALNVLRQRNQCWQSVEWALVACYLSLLTHNADSHVARKHGEAVACKVQQQAGAVLTQFIKYNKPEEATSLLRNFDLTLKAEGINPGTSADLAAACLLVHEFERLHGKR